MGLHQCLTHLTRSSRKMTLAAQPVRTPATPAEALDTMAALARTLRDQEDAQALQIWVPSLVKDDWAVAVSRSPLGSVPM